MSSVTQEIPQTTPGLNQEEKHDLLTVREVAQQLRVDDTTVRRWIKMGALEAIALPHRAKRQAYRVPRGVLERLLLATVVTAS